MQQSKKNKRSGLMTYLPVLPSQILMDLSKEALASSRVSGENSTSLTRAWWPVIRATGFFSSAGFHRKSVKSSEPDTSLSGASPWFRHKAQQSIELKYTTMYTLIFCNLITLHLLWLCCIAAVLSLWFRPLQDGRIQQYISLHALFIYIIIF